MTADEFNANKIGDVTSIFGLSNERVDELAAAFDAACESGKSEHEDRTVFSLVAAMHGFGVTLNTPQEVAVVAMQFGMVYERQSQLERGSRVLETIASGGAGLKEMFDKLKQQQTKPEPVAAE